MKRYLTLLCCMLSSVSWAQHDSVVAHRAPFKQPEYIRHSVQATLSLGFIDANRQYTIPAGFEKNSTSGYANISAKLDYALTNKVSLAANLGYDAFIFNYAQLYQGNNGTIRRNKANNLRIFSLGVIANYHLGQLIKVKHLDPFAGVGISLNNLRYSAYQQGDSTLVKLNHTVTPYLKVGARYYITDMFSIYGDAGYEKQNILSLGFSCRFLPKSEKKK